MHENELIAVCQLLSSLWMNQIDSIYVMYIVLHVYFYLEPAYVLEHNFFRSTLVICLAESPYCTFLM